MRVAIGTGPKKQDIELGSDFLFICIRLYRESKQIKRIEMSYQAALH